MSKSKFLVSKSKVIEQYKKLKDLGCLVSYSVKTFPEICWILEENTDSFFSIHMFQSLRFVKDMKRVWFLTQGLTDDFLDKVFEVGIRKFVVDNESDLKKLLEYIEREKIKIDLLLRVRMREHTIYTGKYFVFGMYSHQINRWIPILRKNNNIENLGVHFHRKTQNTSEWSIKEEISQMLNKQTLESIDLFNIGGGIPVDYKNSSAKNLPYIFKKIVEFRDWMEETGVKTIIEPGRFIAAPSTKLITEVISVYENNVIVDASVYNGALDTIIVPIKLLVEGESDKGEDYVIKGCTPCSMDIFRYNVKLENPPKVGDKIVFLNAGAYNFTTDFCNLQKLPVEFVD
ncbi:MAG: decarboxylase [Candidatus Aenigmatarchaeota archaeon]